MNHNISGTFDPRVVLTEWFTSRTERGRLTWKLEVESMTALASLPPLVHIQFTTHTDADGKCVRWDSFCVHDNYKELFRIDSDDGANDSATLTAVNALFLAAQRSVTPSSRTGCLSVESSSPINPLSCH